MDTRAFLQCVDEIVELFFSDTLKYFDAVLHENIQDAEQKAEEKAGQYEKIGDYTVKNYVERPHEYVK